MLIIGSDDAQIASVVVSNALVVTASLKRDAPSLHRRNKSSSSNVQERCDVALQPTDACI